VNFIYNAYQATTQT